MKDENKRLAHPSSFRLHPCFWTCSSAELERDSAKVEVARSNRARSTNYGPKSNVQSPMSVYLTLDVGHWTLDFFAGVAQQAGGTSLRN